MAQTTSKLFGEYVVEGDAGNVTGMAGPQELTDKPWVDAGIRFAAAMAYQDYLDGRLGPPVASGVQVGDFAAHAEAILDHIVLKASAAFKGRSSLTDTLRASWLTELASAYAEYDV